MIRITRKSLSPPDFRTDVRSSRDALEIVSHADVTHLDWDGFSSLSELVQRMLESTFAHRMTPDKINREVVPLIVRDGRLVKTMTGLEDDAGNNSSLTTFASLPCIKRRFITIATFDQPVDLSPDSPGVLVLTLVLCPSEVKETKSALNTAKVVASLMSDPGFRHEIRSSENQQDLHSSVCKRTKDMMRDTEESTNKDNKIINLFTGVIENFKRRLSHYKSDFTDGVADKRSMSKVLSSTMFLYFLCILPTVAFGALNQKNTSGMIDTKRALIGEGIGGLLFSLFAGQPFVVIATTAPIALCNKIVFDLSLSLDVPFYSLYACVGLFHSFFLAAYGILGLNSLIKFSTRSVEEIFSAFIVCCFVTDAWGDLIENVKQNYGNLSDQALVTTRSVSIIFFLLKNGTLVLALSLSRFQTSRFLNQITRQTISDYALPAAVILFSVLSAGLFHDVRLEKHEVTSGISMTATDMHGLTPAAICVSIVLGFSISVLFFMDQGVSAQLVNSPVHKLRKGNANDMDFVVVAMINVFMSMFGLPWMHGLLPHSPLHVQSLAEMEDQVDRETGHIHRVIVFVRETRIPVIACHVLIVITVTGIPQIFSHIPVPVLDGLFMFCAFASIPGNSFFERISLLWTQQSKYPATHYIRRCEQRKMHYFTLIQVIELIVLVLVGIASPWPYFRMTFPVFIAFLIPIRHFVIEKGIGPGNAAALDSFH